jgi:hypothetical protein
VNGSAGIVSKHILADPTGKNAYLLGINNEGKLHTQFGCVWWRDNQARQREYVSQLLADGEPHLITVTYNGSTVETYVDGKSVAWQTVFIESTALQNKNIPLYVRPFGDKSKPGTVINGEAEHVTLPILIYKRDQVLLIIRSKDFSFVMEEKFAVIFSLLDHFRIKTHLINNSAVDLGLCVDASWHIDDLIKALEEEDFHVEKTENVCLLTIRNYTKELTQKYIHNQQTIIRQVNPESVRAVIKGFCPCGQQK